MNSFPYLAQTSPPQQTESVTTAAPATHPTTQATPPPWWANQFIPLIIGIAVLYLFLFRSKKGEQKKKDNLLAALKKGDRVQTIGGILGNVVEVRDNEVLLKVDESSNTKIRFTRSAIHRVLEEEKPEK